MNLAMRLRVLAEADPIGKLIEAAASGTISLGRQEITLDADQYLAVLRELRRIAVPDAKSAPVRLEGWPTETKTAEDVHAALSLALRKMASGVLTPEETATIAGVLERQRQAIETAELEPRLARLEELHEEQQRRRERRS